MSDIWTVYNAPLWLHWHALEGKLGAVDTNPDGSFTVLHAVPPELATLTFSRLLPGKQHLDGELRTEEATCCIDHENRIWTFPKVAANFVSRGRGC